MIPKIARASMLVLVACSEQFPPSEARPCSPSASDCAVDHVCCSMDAAAIDYDDLAAIVLPRYPGRNDAGGVPSFSDLDNALSRRGMCVRADAVPPAARLPNIDCPVPCNPTWSTADIATVCGPNTSCCQHVELDARDCVLDPSLGERGCWRPVTGADIGVLSSWGVDEHATHQDPGLLADGACAALAAGLPPELDAVAVRSACERRLTVANQQGFCLGAGHPCPYAEPSYRDACERMNDEQDRGGC